MQVFGAQISTSAPKAVITSNGSSDSGSSFADLLGVNSAGQQVSCSQTPSPNQSVANSTKSQMRNQTESSAQAYNDPSDGGLETGDSGQALTAQAIGKVPTKSPNANKADAAAAPTDKKSANSNEPSAAEQQISNAALNPLMLGLLPNTQSPIELANSTMKSVPTITVKTSSAAAIGARSQAGDQRQSFTIASANSVAETGAQTAHVSRQLMSTQEVRETATHQDSAKGSSVEHTSAQKLSGASENPGADQKQGQGNAASQIPTASTAIDPTAALNTAALQHSSQALKASSSVSKIQPAKTLDQAKAFSAPTHQIPSSSTTAAPTSAGKESGGSPDGGHGSGKNDKAKSATQDSDAASQAAEGNAGTQQTGSAEKGAIEINSLHATNVTASSPSPLKLDSHNVAEGQAVPAQGQTPAAAQSSIPQQIPGLADARLIARQQYSELQVSVHTQELGAVQLRANMQGNQIGAVITADRPEAREALAAAIPALHQTLNNRDVQVAVVDRGANTGTMSGDTGSQSGNPQQQKPGTTGSSISYNGADEEEASVMASSSGNSSTLLDLHV